MITVKRIMIELSGIAVMLRADPFKEHDARISLFSQQHGLLHGIARYGMSKKQRGNYAAGNLVEFDFSARLEEHLGSVRTELLAPSGSMVMGQRAHCYALQSMAALMLLAFEQRDAHPVMFECLQQLTQSLSCGGPWQADYARFEATLLRETGYGLQLDSCAVCAKSEHLRYISPKSGAAVCAEHGAPYRDKLFAYPALTLRPMHASGANRQEIRECLELTGYFIQHWLLAAHDKKLPESRARLMKVLNKETAPA